MAPHMNTTESAVIEAKAEEFEKMIASMYSSMRTWTAWLLGLFSPIFHGMICFPMMVLDQIRVLVILALTFFMVYLAMTVPGAQERLISALVPAVSNASQGVVFTTRNSNASIRNTTASVNASVYKNMSVFERTQTSNLSVSLDCVAPRFRCIPTEWLSGNITTCAASVASGGIANATQNFTRDDLLKFQIELQTWVGFTPYFQFFLVLLICCNTLFALHRAGMSECTRIRGWRCLVAVTVLATLAYAAWCTHFSEVYMTKALAPHGWNKSLAVLTARAVEERVEVAFNFTQRHFTEIQQHKIAVHLMDRFVQLDVDLVAQLSRRANLKVPSLASVAAAAYRWSVATWNGPVVSYSLDTVTQALVWVNALVVVEDCAWWQCIWFFGGWWAFVCCLLSVRPMPGFETLSELDSPAPGLCTRCLRAFCRKLAPVRREAEIVATAPVATTPPVAASAPVDDVAAMGNALASLALAN